MKSTSPLILILLLLLSSCGNSRAKKNHTVYYINSYHHGYPASDKTEQSIRNEFKDLPIDLKIAYLDGKRIKEDSVKLHRAEEIYKDILSAKPDILLVSDDDAVKYVVKPYFNSSAMPVLFCGVNWSHEAYKLDDNHIRGMNEVLPLGACLDSLSVYFPASVKLGILSENSLSEKNNFLFLDTLYKNRGYQPNYQMVDDFEQWMKSFIMLNDSCDLIYLPTNGAISGWDKKKAIEFIKKEIKKPIFTCDDFMMDYAVFGMTKVIEEQGKWVSQTCIEVLNGKKISSIENTQNKESKFYWNPEFANIIGFSLPASLQTVIEFYPTSGTGRISD